MNFLFGQFVNVRLIAASPCKILTELRRMKAPAKDTSQDQAGMMENLKPGYYTAVKLKHLIMTSSLSVSRYSSSYPGLLEDKGGWVALRLF